MACCLAVLKLGVVLWQLLCCACVHATSVITTVSNVSLELAEATEGGSAALPCNLAAVHPPDRVTMVQWYRGANAEQPIYRYDLLGARPQHWSDPVLGDRVFMRLLDEERATLTMTPTKLADEDVYHCKVEFNRSPARVTHIQVIVIVPPDGVQVTDDVGIVKNGITSAYAEGAGLVLTCSASSGKPLAKVSWWRDSELKTDDTQYFNERKRSQSILRIEKLTRAHLLAVYSCEVSNSKLQPPLVVRVAIDMYLRPLETRLLGQNSPLSAGRKTNITCRCRGSRPPAIISWWKDGVSLDGGSVAVSADGNTTTSTLSLTPTAADHLLILTCRAANQRIPMSELRDTWTLHVFYPPKVTLTLGHGLDAGDIKEGADVYFECHLVANPWVLRVWWLRDGQRLLSNATAGVIVSNQTLVLQGVSRSSSGRYSCEAGNTEGSTRSTVFYLRVKYEPVCGSGSGGVGGGAGDTVASRRVLGAAKDEPIHIECKVEAEPAASLFRWSFNSTPGISRELTDYTPSAGGSTLVYTPKVAADYGTLSCWGRNELGSQRSPCVFHIVPAGKPDPPAGCSTLNVTHHSILFSCKKGFDGGMRQKFSIVVNLGQAIIANLSSTVPEFLIGNLEPAQEYTLTIFSINAKGWSKGSSPITLRTLPSPSLKEQRRSTGPTTLSTSDNDRTGSLSTALGAHVGGGLMSGSLIAQPWLYILLAGGVTLLAAAAIGTLVLVVKRWWGQNGTDSGGERKSRMMGGLDDGTGMGLVDSAGGGGSVLGVDDKNPDLIPPTNEGLLECNAPYTITARPNSKRNCATQMPVKPYHVTWAPILQSRNCSTQTPPPHKESSV